MELNDQVLDELLDIEQKIKTYEARAKVIRDAIKKRGSFWTHDYVCSVQDRVREGLAGLPEVMKHIEKEALERLGLIRATPYKVVVVTKIKHSNDISLYGPV